MLTLRVGTTWDGAPVGADEAAELRLSWSDGALALAVDAPFHGDPPPACPPGPTEGLWEHEVVEVFLAGAPLPDGRIPYTEVEIGPHGHYLVLRLLGVRAVETRLLPLTLTVTREGSRWRATARLDRRLVPEGPLRGNAYAIHGVGPARRYLAWQPVPGPAPDFHQPERFAPLAITG